jgi:hypothetical protein
MKLHTRMILAKLFPLWFMLIFLDGMDQNKTQHPAQSRPSKDVDGAGEPLQNKFTGTLDCIQNKLFLIMSHSQNGVTSDHFSDRLI